MMNKSAKSLLTTFSQRVSYYTFLSAHYLRIETQARVDDSKYPTSAARVFFAFS